MVISLYSRAFLWAAALVWVCAPPAGVEAANAPTGLLCDLLEHPEETVITTAAPEFGWIYNSSLPNDAQTGYRIIVAGSEAAARRAAGDVWDSGPVKSRASINVLYAGPALRGGADYFWRVQTVDAAGRTSPFSAIQHFRTDTALVSRADLTASDPPGQASAGLVYNASADIWANRYPLRFVAAGPVRVTNTAPGRWFIDFGQDAFGYATIHLKGTAGGRPVQAWLGEMASGNAVDTAPPDGSNIRCAEVTVTVRNGDAVYALKPPPRPACDNKRTVNPPGKFGQVMPFRYLELDQVPGTLTPADVVQERLLDEFNTNAAAFDSSSPALNQIWALCRNSMRVLSFDGVYIDGDRERTPYEADCYIQQLSTYAVDREFTLLRYSFEYLLQHPTWPTEWKFHMIFIAWADYLQTGNRDLISRYYDALKPDLLSAGASRDGLIRGYPNFPTSATSKDSDVVDWPPDDRDGFVIKEGRYLNWTNAVNNALYYRSLQIMADMAAALGRAHDAAAYTAEARKVYASYNAVLWDNVQGCYVDGVGTTHASAHANFFPLACGLVPADRKESVINHIHARIADRGGMPASVYGAQYLLTALFENGDTDTALALLTTNGPRGWLNMINMGSTLTTEAWNFADKKNMDWNHAWGAAPGNLISRFVLGLCPLDPGYGRILIQPHLGTTLSYVSGIVPTIRGPVSIQATNAPGSFQLLVDIPGNVTATVRLPATGEARAAAVLDGNLVPGTVSGGWLTVTNIGSGRHSICLGANGKPVQTALLQ